MKTKEKNIPMYLLVSISVLLILIAFMIIAQCSLGRYTSSFGGAISFSPTSKSDLQLNYGEWTVDQELGVQTQTLSVAQSADGSTAGSAQVRVRLYVPGADITLPEMRLVQNGSEHLATVSKIVEGTTVYRSYGDGQICCFYGADGKELTFDLLDSSMENLNFTLKLNDGQIDTSGIRWIVENVNNDGKGGDQL